MNCSFLKDYRKVGVIILFVISLLILIFGEKARHSKEVADGKFGKPEPVAEIPARAELAPPKPAAIAPEAPPAKPLPPVGEIEDIAVKDDTGGARDVTGGKTEENRLDQIIGEEPENQSPQPWFPAAAPSTADESKDGVKPAMQEALKLSERFPGRFQSVSVAESHSIFGIDTTNGRLWLLRKDGTKWEALGSPLRKGPNVEAGTYTIIHASDQRVTVMNSASALTWQVEAGEDGKWNWRVISGIPDDMDWK